MNIKKDIVVKTRKGRTTLMNVDEQDSVEFIEILNRKVDDETKEITVFVQNIGGRTYNIQIKNSATVQELKQTIQSKEGIPVEQQRLVFEGRLIENSCSLSDYNIQHESRVFMSLRITGS